MDLWDKMCDVNEPDVDLQASFLDIFDIKQPSSYIGSLIKMLVAEELSKRKLSGKNEAFKKVTDVLLKHLEAIAVANDDTILDDATLFNLLILVEVDYDQDEFTTKINNHFEKTLSDYVSSSIFTQFERNIIVSRLKFLYKLYKDLDEEVSDGISFAVKYGYYDDNYRLSFLIKSIVKILYAMEAAHRVQVTTHGSGNENIYEDESFKNIKTRLFLIFKNEIKAKFNEQRKHEFYKFAVVESLNEYDISSDVIIGYTLDGSLDKKLNKYAKEVEEVNKTYKLIKLK